MRRGRPLSGAILLLLLALPAPARAHGDIHDQIVALTGRIARDPRNPALYLRRGELHRVHREWSAALSDYDLAGKLRPDMAAVDLCRGRMWLQAGRPRKAARALRRFLARRPDHVEARESLARALVRLGQRLAAVEQLSAAIARSPQPRPEQYLERAQALAPEGPAHTEEALRGLDEGIRRLGPLVSLQLPAIELELRSGRTENALARLETLAARAERKEPWLERRGEILERAGRAREAREAYAAALAALETVPSERRQRPAERQLEGRLRAAIERHGKG